VAHRSDLGIAALPVELAADASAAAGAPPFRLVRLVTRIALINRCALGEITQLFRIFPQLTEVMACLPEPLEFWRPDPAKIEQLKIEQLKTLEWSGRAGSRS
jgi:hypothetical protein